MKEQQQLKKWFVVVLLKIDARANVVVIESVTVETEGWERNSNSNQPP